MRPSKLAVVGPLPNQYFPLVSNQRQQTTYCVGTNHTHIDMSCLFSPTVCQCWPRRFEISRTILCDVVAPTRPKVDFDLILSPYYCKYLVYLDVAFFFKIKIEFPSFLYKVQTIESFFTQWVIFINAFLVLSWYWYYAWRSQRENWRIPDSWCE